MCSSQLTAGGPGSLRSRSSSLSSRPSLTTSSSAAGRRNRSPSVTRQATGLGLASHSGPGNSGGSSARRRDVRPPRRPPFHPPPRRASVISCGVGTGDSRSLVGDWRRLSLTRRREHPGILRAAQVGRAWRVRRQNTPQSSFATVATRRRGRTIAHVTEAAGPPRPILPRGGKGTNWRPPKIIS